MAVTKSSGKYFTERDRVWLECDALGRLPFYIGRWKGEFILPERPMPGGIAPLFSGVGVLPRVQRNRVGCFDLTFSASKSVSILLHVLTPPAEWGQSADIITRAAVPVVERRLAGLSIADGPGGRTRIPAEGIAIGYCHFLSAALDPQAHLHGAVPNVAAADNGKTGSIRNAYAFFTEQGADRAEFHKRIDDQLQYAGYRTRRAGRAVEIVGIPREMIAEFSTARAAMAEARSRQGFHGPRAADFYARQARRGFRPSGAPTPEVLHAKWGKTAARYGVTREWLRTDPSAAPIRDPMTRAMSAYGVARKAVRVCGRRYGDFTESQYRETLYLLAIGKPTTVQDLEREMTLVLTRPKYAGVSRVATAAGTNYYRASGSTRRASGAAARHPREAWEKLAGAVKAGVTFVTRTALRGAALFTKLATAGPEPRVIRLDTRDAEAFLARHSPTPYFRAHAKALLRGLFAPGNPHEKAAAAERAYARLRSHARLPERSLLVVDRWEELAPRQLRRLARLAGRDGASVVLAGERTRCRGSNSHTHNQERRV